MWRRDGRGRALAAFAGLALVLWSATATAECLINDCRRLGISVGAREFVYGNVAGDDLTFFYGTFEVGGANVAFELDSAVTKSFQLFGPSLLIRGPIWLDNAHSFAIEPTLGIGPEFWFWSKEKTRNVKGVSLRLSPRMRMIYNVNRSVALSLDLVWADVLPVHYGFDTKAKSDHPWMWMSFGVGVYHRF